MGLELGNCRFGEDVVFGVGMLVLLLALIGGAAFVGAIIGSRRKDK